MSDKEEQLHNLKELEAAIEEAIRQEDRSSELARFRNLLRDVQERIRAFHA
jgi:dsDNA-specific endonuclease/ATPase MutS2